MMKKFIYILVILVLFTGCGKKETVDETSSIKKEDPIVEEKKLNIIDLDSKSRPYAVMINNIGVARPVQSGLQDAYVVYELIVEGGITRMLALFKDAETERIGSIRSARHYYLDYALEHDAIYVHIGESPQAGEDISSLKVTELPGSSWYYRDNPLKLDSEHTAFSSIERMDKAASNISRKETKVDNLLNYSVEEHTYEGDSATEVDIKYSNSMTANYKYDEVVKVYLRSVNDKSHKDFVTKKQYTVKNIIAYEVDNYTIPGGDKGRQELKNIGTGKGVYISNGVSVAITWEKKSRTAQTVYKTSDGKELIVNDGNTFIQIYPTSGNITIK